MTDFITEIKERRVLPAIGVYAAGCWVLIEILDRLVERYLLSPVLTDIVFWGLYSLIPAVVLVAWSYGRPGKDKATTAQKVGVPINIIATTGLLITAFGGKDLGATANVVTLANEEGQQETHYIPTESYRRRMAVFFFDNKSGDPELDWLQYGMTNLLIQDLQQDLFVAANSPWDNWGNGFYRKMHQAGFEDGLRVPRSLMREIADDANRQHFVSGEVNRQGGQYVVTARIWDTQNLDLVAEMTATGWDIYQIAEQLSEDIQQALEVPAGSHVAQKMPLSETYGESEEAFQWYIEALNLRLFDNDIAGADAAFDKALEADPNFVLGWFIKGLNQFEGGDMPAAQASLEQARNLDYRLPERDRNLLKVIGYRLAGESDKVIALLELQAQLYDDAASHTRLANMLMFTGEPEAAKAQYLTALGKDPMNVAIYQNLSLLERSTGNMDGAVQYAKSYQQAKPEDQQAQIMLGDLLRDTGELEKAVERYNQAQLLSDSPTTALLRLSEMAARNGDIAEARNLIEQAEASADSPLAMTQVRAAASQLEYRLGRLHASVEQINAEYEYAVQALPPVAVAIAIYDPLVRNYLDLNDVDRAEQSLMQGKSLLQPPLDQFLSFAEAYVHINRGDQDAAKQALSNGEAILEQFDFDALNFQVLLVNAEMAIKREDWEASASYLEQSVEEFKQSILSSEYYAFMPMFYAKLAYSQLQAGHTDAAEFSINEGMKLDPNQPLLWLVKARYQEDAGMQALAAASVQYALAIWADADPDYVHFSRALSLAQKLGVGKG